MAIIRVLLVDDNEMVRFALQSSLEAREFEVTAASSVHEALKRITSESFDVLLTDLHMPGAGDGLTLASVMRHMNPSAVTIVISADPDMGKAAAAIRRQTDEVLRKPVQIATVVEVMRRRLTDGAV